jgi:hypothetical protein
MKRLLSVFVLYHERVTNIPGYLARFSKFISAVCCDVSAARVRSHPMRNKAAIAKLQLPKSFSSFHATGCFVLTWLPLIE